MQKSDQMVQIPLVTFLSLC